MILTATLMLVMAGQKREAHLRARGPGRSRFCLHLIKDVDPGDIGAKQSFVASRGHDEFRWQALLHGFRVTPFGRRPVYLQGANLRLLPDRCGDFQLPAAN
jgi:hypothetical protein